MKGKQVETSSRSSSSSEDEEEDEDDDDDDDDDDDANDATAAADDDQSSSSTSDLDEESIKLINKVEKMIQRLNVKGVLIQIQDFIFTNKKISKERMDVMDAASWGTLWKFI